METVKNDKTYYESNKEQISETFLLGAILALAGGYLDAYSYLARGKVFANAQTGNMVLFGIKLMEGQLVEAINYMIPIFAFVAGILIAEGIKERFHTLDKGHWRQIVLGVEILTIAVVSAIPKGEWNIAANTLISFVCALQVESFRKLNGNTFASTMCTGNLRSGTECLYRFLFKGDKPMKNKWIQYYGIIIVFVVGAGIGAGITARLQEKSILACCIPLAGAIIWMSKSPLESKKS